MTFFTNQTSMRIIGKVPIKSPDLKKKCIQYVFDMAILCQKPMGIQVKIIILSKFL